MRTVAMAVLFCFGVSLLVDAGAFEGRYSESALATLDHGAKEFRHSIDNWLSSRTG
jgi:hypothetical protein